MGERNKIALIEIDYHSEVLLNLANIFRDLNFSVDIFCSQKIFNRIPSEERKKFTIHSPENNKKITAFFKMYLNDLNNFDLIFFTTLASQFKFFSNLNLKPKKILLVHNANIYINPYKSFGTLLDLESLKNFIYYFIFRSLGKFDIFYRYKFLRKVDFICFPGKEIHEYVTTNLISSDDKILPYFPLVMSNSEPSLHICGKGKIQITIIGRIEKTRKNYTKVFEAFKSIVESIANNVELILLGSPVGNYGRNIISNFKSIENEKFSVKTYSQYVDQQEFDRVISLTDFLIIPVIEKTQFRDHIEIYGKTKITGNINDIILHCKPALVPSKYPLNFPLNKVTKQYSDRNELSMILLNWINKSEHLELNKNLKLLQKYYSRDHILEEFKNIFYPLLDNKD